jgi:hypothetical protein
VIAGVEEPYIKAKLLTPERYIGSVMELCRERRGSDTTIGYLAVGRVELTCEIPLAEVLFDFYDRLKSLTQGYGSFDYEFLDHRPVDLVKVDILVNGERVDALSQLTHRDKARRARPALLRAAGRDDPEAAAQDRGPGRHRRHDHRPHHDHRLAQGRDGEVLRGRHHAQAQAPGEAEGRQEADEDHRLGRHPASRLRRRAQDGYGFVRDETARAGLYLHVPFCASICPYCDFAVRKGDAARRRRFADALLAEIGLHEGTGLRFDTVYFGGGTPSQLEPGDLGRLLDALRGRFELAPRTRVFLEANPEDVTPALLADWRGLGVSTVSLGVQALHADALAFLGRSSSTERSRSKSTTCPVTS